MTRCDNCFLGSDFWCARRKLVHNRVPGRFCKGCAIQSSRAWGRKAVPSCRCHAMRLHGHFMCSPSTMTLSFASLTCAQPMMSMLQKSGISSWWVTLCSTQHMHVDLYSEAWSKDLAVARLKHRISNHEAQGQHRF